MDTKHIPGGELIRSLKPVPIDTATTRRYRQAIENRIFPMPTALNIQTVPTDPDHGLVVISIPPQEEELKPFLVHGAIVDGRIEGAYLTMIHGDGDSGCGDLEPLRVLLLPDGNELVSIGNPDGMNARSAAEEDIHMTVGRR